MPGGLINRRGLLGSAMVFGAGTADALASLASAATSGGRVFGAAVRSDTLRNGSGFDRVLARECAYLTPELALKWSAVQPRPGGWALKDMDELAAFARGHAKRLHGHTLIWHRSTPDWAAARLLEYRDFGPVADYFEMVIARYGRLIDAWDVVNEPLAEGEGVDGLRPSVFLQAFGPDYIRRSLETARGLAPKARLLINEYGLEGAGEDAARRRARMLRLVDELKRQGVPLDGVGLQSHLDLHRPRIDERALADFLQALADRGLQILVTELDVKEADYILTAEQRDAAVAEIVGRYLDVALAQAGLRSVSTWGLSDRYSWLQVTPADLAAHPGAWQDGSSPGVNRGLPLDASFQPKPMYHTLQAALRRRT